MGTAEAAGAKYATSPSELYFVFECPVVFECEVWLAWLECVFECEP